MSLAAIKAAPVAGAAARSRVVIVDDSAVARAVLARICVDEAGCDVAGCYGDAASALDGLSRHGADIILLDIAMPGTDGLTALPDILYAGAGAPIVVCSSAAAAGGVAAVQALALGAADTIAKPQAQQPSRDFARDLAERVVRLARAPRPAPHATMSPGPQLRPFDAIAISASTGGIHALSQLLRPIPPTLTVPILVTQHLPDAFMPYFANQLALLAGRPASIAQDGMPAAPGRVLVAPGDAHLTVVRSASGAVVRLQRRAAASGCCPSADPMLASFAGVYGARALAVTLSGMGRDGLAGAAAIRQAGGQLLVQDAESAVVWGMPGAVARAGLADAILPPAEIGAMIARSG